MVDRLRRCLLLLLAAGLWAVSAPASAPADPPRRIVAIGDLHGDYAVWQALARAAGLIDARGRWAGGDTVFVQTGDVTDRGPDSLRIIHDLMRLSREATRAGGRVVTLVGNHEAMNVSHDLRYVDPGEYAAFVDGQSARRRDNVYAANRAAIEASYRQTAPKLDDDAIRRAWQAKTPLGWVEHRIAWSPAGELGKWAIASPAVVKIGDSLFVHGGLSPAYAALAPEEINRRVAAALAAAETAPESILAAEDSPLWYRGLPADAAGVDAILAAQGVRRVIVGHTPVMKGVEELHGGKLVMIDTGNAEHYGGTPSYIEIVGGRVIAHAVPRPSARQGGAER